MAPAVSILQLDTGFPRVPGDVGCPETYRDEVEVICVPKATVGQIVSARPDLIDISPFETALEAASGDIIVTSCGFLSYWQDHLAALTDRPVICSSLSALGALSTQYDPDEVLTLTFDAQSLVPLHFGSYMAFAHHIVGLPESAHLRQVISQNRTTLDTSKAEKELKQLVTSFKTENHRHLLLECTNLPPYKAMLKREFGLPVTDILTCIEAARPGTVDQKFLE